MKMRRCRSCGEPIRFVRTVSGRYLPVDARPSPLRGNILIERGVAKVVGAAERSRARDQGYDLFVSHFASCPNAPAHRRLRPNRGFVEESGPEPVVKQLELL